MLSKIGIEWKHINQLYWSTWKRVESIRWRLRWCSREWKKSMEKEDETNFLDAKMRWKVNFQWEICIENKLKLFLHSLLNLILERVCKQTLFSLFSVSYEVCMVAFRTRINKSAKERSERRRNYFHKMLRGYESRIIYRNVCHSFSLLLHRLLQVQTDFSTFEHIQEKWLGNSTLICWP